MTFHTLFRSAAVGAVLVLAPPSFAAGFNGAVTIRPQIVDPAGPADDLKGPYLPVAVLVVLIALALQGGAGTGSDYGE